MRPVAILQHEAHQGPGFLHEFLQEQGVPVRLLRPDLGDPIPRSAADYSGLVVLGSEHSVHDRLDWIRAEQRLIQDAVRLDMPVLGHCFGAQQLALALGARVTRNAWPNIGWSRLWVTPEARPLFGGEHEVQVFNWHYDTFEIPRGARRTLFGPHCLNKGFALGPHMGFQCHLEVTEASVRQWCASGQQELGQVRGPAVQSASAMLRGLRERAQGLHQLARGVYRQWSAQLERPALLHRHGA